MFDEIRRAVVSAFFSLPRGGAEIGGILLGTVSGRKISIQGYQVLDCEYATGPSFTLSPRDQAQLAGMVASAAGERDGPRVVGWYHSHTRSGIFLSRHDLDIHRRFFSEPWQVALVLVPHPLEPPRCGFFFWEADGTIRGEASYREFVLAPLAARPALSGNAAHLPPSYPPRHPESDPEAPALGAEPALRIVGQIEAPVAARRERALSPESSLKTRDVLKVVGWLLFALLVLAIGLTQIPSFREGGARGWAAISHPPVAAPLIQIPLGLQAERQKGDVKLTWNRQSAAVLTATSGVLSIEDGNTGRTIRLDPAQIRNGSVLYAPTTGQIQMQLTLSAPHETNSESVLVVLPDTGAPRVEVVPEKGLQDKGLPNTGLPNTGLPNTGLPEKGLPEKGRRERGRPERGLSEKKLAAVPIVRAKQPNLTPPPRPVKPFRLGTVSRSIAPAETSFSANEPPNLAAARTDPAALIPSALRQPAVQLPSPAPAPPAPAPQAAATSSPNRTISSAPVYPPAIVRSVPAVYPAELRNIGMATKTVEIKVSIDRTGRVLKAEPIRSKGPVHQAMIQAALAATSHFKFKPARIGDEPVPGEIVLRFDFAKP